MTPRSWRIEGWQFHLDRVSRDGNLLFGEGLGTYYGRDQYGEIRPTPHSAYIELILKFGLFGLTLYGLLVFKFIRNALAVRKTLGTGPMRAWLEASILTFGAAHAYCSGYSFEPIMLMFLAVGNSAQRLSRLPAVEFRAVSRRTSFQRTPHSAGVMPIREAGQTANLRRQEKSWNPRFSNLRGGKSRVERESSNVKG